MDLSQCLDRIELVTHCIKETFTEETIRELQKVAKIIAAPRKALVLTAGNGGSHSLAEHLTGELVWRLNKENELFIPSVCLSSNSTILTALSNDLDYKRALSTYAFVIGDPAKVDSKSFLIGFTTSGKSENIINLIDKCGMIMPTILFAGLQAQGLLTDYIFTVKGLDQSNTAIIQEIHQIYIHLLCEMISKEKQKERIRCRKSNVRRKK